MTLFFSGIENLGFRSYLMAGVGVVICQPGKTEEVWQSK